MQSAKPLRELENANEFIVRHIGINAADEALMLSAIGAASRRAMIDGIVPRSIARSTAMAIPAAITEAAALAELKTMAGKNKVFKSFIGQGYYDTHTPGVILRNILENPAWYTAYTPYQAEISQGRMEALINFQTMVCDLTGMAGLTPAAVICEILKSDGTMARLPDLIEYSKTHQLKIGTIADLIQYRSEHESVIERVGAREIETPWGMFQAVAYRDTVAGAPHLALVSGDVDPTRETLVRVHEPTSVLDVLDVNSPGHSWGVGQALQAIKAAPAGVMVFLHCQSSTEQLFGQIASWKADAPLTPVNERARMDLRTYGMGAQILRDLHVGQMRLLARPRKMPSIMPGFGLDVTGYDYEPTTRNT